MAWVGQVGRGDQHPTDPGGAARHRPNGDPRTGEWRPGKAIA